MKFSITIPAYKDQYLNECIDSILSQTYTDFEIIIVNDASPYDLDAIVAKYDDNRIRYYKNDVGFGGYNVVGNWNKCLELAKGDFVICMGDDDRLLPNCLADYNEIINKYPDLNVYHMRTEMIDEHSNLIDMQVPAPERESVYELIWNIWKGRDQYIGDFLFRTSKLREKGGFYFLPYAWSSDKISVFMMAEDNGIANTYNPGFQYRKSSMTITNSCKSQRDRTEALLGEKEWYVNFIKTPHFIGNEIEHKYLDLIIRNIDKHMHSKIFDMICWDVTESPENYEYWKLNSEKFQIDKKELRHLLYISYKERIKRLFHK